MKMNPLAAMPVAPLGRAPMKNKGKPKMPMGKPMKPKGKAGRGR